MKAKTMQGIISILAVVLPMLKDYFTKNAGLNTVSGGVLGVIGTILITNAGSVDQMITAIQNQGPRGVVVAALIIGVRTAIFAYNSAKQA